MPDDGRSDEERRQYQEDVARGVEAALAAREEREKAGKSDGNAKARLSAGRTIVFSLIAIVVVAYCAQSRDEPRTTRALTPQEIADAERYREAQAAAATKKAEREKAEKAKIAKEREEAKAREAALLAALCTDELAAAMDEIAYDRRGTQLFVDNKVWSLLMYDVKQNMMAYWHKCHRGTEISSAQDGKPLAEVTWLGEYEIVR